MPQVEHGSSPHHPRKLPGLVHPDCARLLLPGTGRAAYSQPRGGRCLIYYAAPERFSEEEQHPKMRDNRTH